MPHFMENTIAGPVMPAEPSEYRDLGDEFHSTMPFSYFSNMKIKNRPKNFNRGFTQNYELKKIVGRFTIPNFEGSRSCSQRIWVQKFDIYFQLNLMTETDAIKLATLHLDGEAHEWWCHGLVTLGHNTITSYSDFTQRLMERFDKGTRRYISES